MPRAEEPVRAIGRLSADGPWVGFQAAGQRYRLVFGMADGSLRPDPTRDPGAIRAGLIASAIAYFSEALGEPPAEIAATQADLAQLIGRVGGDPADPRTERQAQDAMDAIDDGLPGDAVALRLAALSPQQSTDPLVLLAERLRFATASGAS